MKLNNLARSAYREAARQCLPRAPRGAFFWSPPDGERLVVAYGRVGPEASASALAQAADVRAGLGHCRLPIVDFGLFTDRAGGQTWVIVAAATTYAPPAPAWPAPPAGTRPPMAAAPDHIDVFHLYQVTALVWEAWAHPDGRDRRSADWAGGPLPDDGAYGPPPVLPGETASQIAARKVKEALRWRARKQAAADPSDRGTNGMGGMGMGT